MLLHRHPQDLGLWLHPAKSLVSINLALQELGRRSKSFVLIREMCSGDCKSAITHKVAHGTVHFQVLTGVAVNPPTVLGILCVAEEHDTLDLVADGAGQLGDCAGDDGGTLTRKMLAR